MPQVAIPSPGLFYPPNLTFAWFDYSVAVALQMILHQLVLAVGTYLLLRSYLLARVSAALAGITLGLCGYSFALESNYTMTASIAWVPLAFFCLHKAETCGKLASRWTTAGSIAVFLTVTAGRPEMMAPGLFILGAKPAIQLINFLRKKDGAPIAILSQFLTIAVGLFLASPCILPALEWLSLSRRSVGLSEDEVFVFSASWYDLVGLLTSQPLGDLCLRNAPFLALVTSGRMAPYVPSSFVGPIAIALALVACMDNTWRNRWIWIGGAVAVAIFCLGNNTPLGPALLTAVPALSLLRFPSKFLIFLAAIIALMAAFGVEAVWQKKSLRLTPLLYLWSALFVASLLLYLPGSESIFGESANPEVRLAGTRAIANGLLLACVGGLSTTLLCLAVIKNKLNHFAFAVLVVCLSGLLLTGSAVRSQQHFGPADYFEQKSFLLPYMEKSRALKRASLPHIYPAVDITVDRQFRSSTLFFEVFTCPRRLQQGDPAANTVSWYSYARQMLYPATNIDSAMMSTFGYESSMKGDYFKSYLDAYLGSTQCRGPQENASDQKLLHLLQSSASDVLITQMYRFAGQTEDIPRLNPKQFELLHEDFENNVRLYRFNTLPRLFLTDKWSWRSAIPPEQEIDSPLEQTALTLPLGKPAENLPQPALSTEAPSLKLLSEACDSMKLATKSKSEVMLIVCDQYYPGWSATVDGKPQQIFPANKFFRAVSVPPGDHQVEFFYAPDSLKRGLILVFFSVATLVATGFCTARQGRSPQRRDSTNE
ncbi:MAG: YfhO family protein [Candidatus Obscuribacterales bacterium]|nr:YfhO family protein [Candidatus Obscuribacterales bacterium]